MRWRGGVEEQEMEERDVGEQEGRGKNYQLLIFQLSTEQTEQTKRTND
jgi:hypothetical protein